MAFRRDLNLFSPFLAHIALALLSLGVADCGGTGPARVATGPMPESGTFTGVWFSPQYGEMHMRQNGNQVIGEFTMEERRGRIEGTATGNVLHFRWTQTRELIPGRPTQTRGGGYFVYQISPEGEHVILGEWGHDNQETGGGPWRAAKSRTRRVHLSTDPVEEPSTSSSIPPPRAASDADWATSENDSTATSEP